MTQEINRSIDRVDCIVGWDPKQSRMIHEVMNAPRFAYDVMVHENMAAFRRWDAPLSREICHNIVTLQGKNKLNDIMFHGDTQITTWYVLIFSTNTTCVNTMTYAVPVFTESTVYDEATRPAYVEAASSSQITTNTASRAVFTMNDTATIYGCGLVGGGTDPTVKANTAGGGCLYSASLFSAAKSVVATNVLSVGISITQS